MYISQIKECVVSQDSVAEGHEEDDEVNTCCKVKAGVEIQFRSTKSQTSGKLEVGGSLFNPL